MKWKVEANRMKEQIALNKAFLTGSEHRALDTGEMH